MNTLIDKALRIFLILVILGAFAYLFFMLFGIGG